MLETVKIILMWVGVAGLVFLIWLVIEGALTVRKARQVVSDLSERVEPTLAHLEKITSELEPAMSRVDPLMERVSLTVDTVNLELMQVDKILSDASSMSGTANNAVQKISAVTSAPSNAINAAASKLRTTFGKKKVGKRAEKAIDKAKAKSLASGASLDEEASQIARSSFDLDGDGIPDFMDDADAPGTEIGNTVTAAAKSTRSVAAEAPAEPEPAAEPESAPEPEPEPAPEPESAPEPAPVADELDLEQAVEEKASRGSDLNELIEEPELAAEDAIDAAESAAEQAADEYFSAVKSDD